MCERERKRVCERASERESVCERERVCAREREYGVDRVPSCSSRPTSKISAIRCETVYLRARVCVREREEESVPASAREKNIHR